MNQTKFLNPRDYERLQSTLEKNAETNARDTTIIFTSMFTGARPGEVLDLTIADLDFDRQALFIRGAKNSNDREIPVPAWLFKRIEKLAKDRDPKEKLFPIALRTYQQIWDQYRPRRIGVKCLRHTFAIRLYEKTKDVRLVQKALGHKCLNSTQVYTDYVYSVEELRKLLF